MTVQLNQVPLMDEVWKVGNTFYLVRFVLNTQPPIPLVWQVSPADVKALGITRPTRTLSAATFAKSGALPMGNSRELLNTTEDPVKVIQSNYDTEVKVKPWLADPEIMALWVGAALEGRSITTAEMQGTEWWRSHSVEERQWLALNASDPTTADRLIADNRLRVADLFQQAGVDNASLDLVNLIADNWTSGVWTQVHAVNQIRLLADPLLTGTLDPLLSDFRDGLDSTRENEDVVRNMIARWLGPAYGENWTQDNIDVWASRLREDPDARLELEDILKRHRQALFPGYENANLSYEDIAAPWRGVWNQVWGQAPDETDPLFTQIVRLNDLASATTLLRQKGLEQGNATVANSLISDIGQAFGGSVRRADPAIR